MKKNERVSNAIFFGGVYTLSFIMLLSGLFMLGVGIREVIESLTRGWSLEEELFFVGFGSFISLFAIAFVWVVTFLKLTQEEK